VSVFAPGELAVLRRDRQAIFDKTATILRKSIVPDGMGGQTDTYTSAGTYPCSFSKFMVRPAERESGPLVREEMHWVFVFPFDAVIDPTDRIQVDGRTFEVVGQGVGSYDLSNRVIALEII
jgi:hypothetical protein